MRQAELTANAAAGRGTDRFAEARAAHPDARLIRFHDRRTGFEFDMAVPPSSPWYELLPPQQDVDITAPHGRAARE